MAYCLRSFIDTLDQVLHPDKHHQKWVLDHEKKPQIQSIFQNATFLQHFLDQASPQIQERIECVEDRIMEEAEKAKSSLESYISDQVLSNTDDQTRFMISPPDLGHVLLVFEDAMEEFKAAGQTRFMISPPDLGQVLQVFEDAMEEFKAAGQTRFMISPPDLGQVFEDAMEEFQAASQPSDDDFVVPDPVSLPFDPDYRNQVIGMEDDLNQLKDRLTSRSSKLVIIPIVGMGGIGKTALARTLYDDHLCRSYFEYLFWVTVSKSYDPLHILKTLVSCVTSKPIEDMHLQNIDSLLPTLHKALYGRSYLIVIDDIWSPEAWDAVRTAFPQDNQGSRIILTTRVNTLANYVMSNNNDTYSHEVYPLNQDESWNLLDRKVFGKNRCPSELEEIGRRIAVRCRGIPIAIVMLGGLLSHTQQNKYSWERVAYNLSTFLAKTDDHFLGIFSLIFTQLPHYLKPCFLYTSALMEDHDIGASKIIKLWVAEGFLKPTGDKNLEEAAEIYLNALVDRGLILVHRRKKNGKAKSYHIHSLLRDLCLKKAHEKKFLNYVKDSQTDILQDEKLCLGLVSSHSPINTPEGFMTMKLASRTHSYLLLGNSKQYKLGHCVCFKPSLLHVLDVYQVKVDEFPEVFLQLVNLRYLAICTKPGEIPRSIYVLTNLQTLIVKYLMSSIALVLALPKLRHFELDDLIRTYESRHDTFIGPHETLQSLCNIPLEILAENLLGKLPKLRKLGIKCGYYIDNVDLTCFEELETLKCCNGFYLANGNFISNIIFPDSVKKLTLNSCGVAESLLDAIGMLPNLEVLKLDGCIFRWPDWEPFEGGFGRLRYLQISRVRNLNKLRAYEEHFPSLEHLVLRHCPNLSEIPFEIGEIPTLMMIEVDECKASLFESARMILDEQQEMGNDQLQLRLGSVIGDEEEKETR